MSVRASSRLGVVSFATLCALLLLVGSVAAQQSPAPVAPAQLFIKVVTKSGTPLRGATVTVNTSTDARSTNAEGLVEFSDLPAGVARVQVLLNGWKPAGAQVTLSAGKRANLDVTLEPHPAPTAEVPLPASSGAPEPTPAPER